MDFLEHYKKRVTYKGNSLAESKINHSKDSLDRNFKTNPSYYLSDIDGKKVDTIVNTTRNFNVKLINFKSDYEPIVGSVITFKGEKYLIMEKDKSEVYVFANMEKCNNVFQIEVERKKVYVGDNSNGIPIFEEEVVYRDEPCIVRENFYSTNDNNQLPLPEGRLLIILKSQEADNVRVNFHFTMYGKEYSISDIGYTSSMNGEGLMEISAERKADNNEKS